MKKRTKIFIQDLYHEIDDENKAEEFKENIIPAIGYVVMYFNGLEQSINHIICKIFSDRADNMGLIVLHKMNYSAKVDLFKRFSDDFHSGCQIFIDDYEDLIRNLRECGRLRNLVVHADWENTNEEGFTYVNLKISKENMHQEYVQFSESSLDEIINLIITTEASLWGYWEERNEKLYGK